jgi:hypothetical protein
MAAPRAPIVPRAKPPAAGAARKAGGKAGSWQAGVSHGLKGLSYEDQADTLQPSRESMKLPTAVIHPGLLELQSERFRPSPEAGRAAKPAQATTTTPATPAAPARSETGIASRVAVGRFSTAARALTADWATLDVNGRGQRLGAAANAELTAVPQTVIQVKALPTNAGEFGFTGWTLDLNENLFQRATIVPPLLAGVADTVYHEARHCEQWYRMAQLEAGKGKDGTAIAQALSIPKRIGDLAAASPLQGTSTEGLQAQTWYDSIYGANATARNATLNDMAAKSLELRAAHATYTADNQAYSALPAATTPEAKQAAYAKAMASYAIWQRLNGEYDVLYRAYRALPEEADAWATGGAAGDAMRATP